MPIVMVTGRDDIVDRVVGLELGADDYITKPFHVREVLARVRSVIRRTSKAAETSSAELTPVETRDSPAFAFDGLTIVPERFELFDRSGDLCDLTSGDFKLLNVFLKHAKRILSPRSIDGPDGWHRMDAPGSNNRQSGGAAPKEDRARPDQSKNHQDRPRHRIQLRLRSRAGLVTLTAQKPLKPVR